ncbi:MAG: class I SAM-dependent methyltransferase [Candidatus Omnitrophica bacterium]|nr:class I SAM-dependent methyltransferase [Candidatus Omnitrophota bacterium]
MKSVFVNERIVELPFVLQALSALPQRSCVLDVGCNESPLALQLACLGYRVTGYDFRGYPYKHPNLDALKGDILNMPFQDDYYDAVTAVSTVEHLGLGFYDDPLMAEESDRRAIQEIKRVLKKDGLLLLTVPYGRKSISEQQRIYNQGSLRCLLQDFEVEVISFFKNVFVDPEKLNTWVQTSQSDISQVASAQTTNGVCLVKARNKKKKGKMEAGNKFGRGHD